MNRSTWFTKRGIGVLSLVATLIAIVGTGCPPTPTTQDIVTADYFYGKWNWRDAEGVRNELVFLSDGNAFEILYDCFGDVCTGAIQPRVPWVWDPHTQTLRFLTSDGTEVAAQYDVRFNDVNSFDLIWDQSSVRCTRADPI